MKFTQRTRNALSVRREDRDMKIAGYRKHETDWEIHRDLGTVDHIILDAKISVCRKYIWTKIGKPTAEYKSKLVLWPNRLDQNLTQRPFAPEDEEYWP